MDKTREIAELTSIITSATFKSVLAEHKENLRKEMETFVSQQNWTEAYGALKRLRDADKIVDLAAKKIQDLEKKK